MTKPANALNDFGNKEIVQKLVDLDTGELVEFYKGDRITRKRQNEAISKAIETKEINNEIKEWNEELGGFVFVLYKYCDTILTQHPQILQEDITKLFYLATYVDYDGYLIYDYSYMTKNVMQEVLHMSINPFSTFFNKMKKFKIFIQDENKNIKMNKEYFTKGEIDKEIQEYYNYTRMYINTIRYLYEHVDIRKHKQLGNYFKIVPYIHRQQNSLCWNPDSNKKDIKLMTVKDLQEVLGYHRNGVRGFIKELFATRLENGEAIIGLFRTEYDESTSKIVVNPKVFYGGNFNLKEGRDTIVKLFKV